jgi:hypothetical protein
MLTTLVIHNTYITTPKYIGLQRTAHRCVLVQEFSVVLVQQDYLKLGLNRWQSVRFSDTSSRQCTYNDTCFHVLYCRSIIETGDYITLKHNKGQP